MSETDADSSPPPATRSAESPVAAAPRRRSWLRVPFAFLLWLFLVLLLTVFWVLGTQSGLWFALSVAEELAPGLVRVEQADGRILGDLHLKGVKVQTPALELMLNSLDLRWSPLVALSGTLRIAELSVRGLDLATAPSEQEEDPGPIELPQLVLPLRIDLEQALVEDLSIGTLGEDARFRIDRIALAASWLGSDLTLKELSLTLPEPLLEASAQGGATLTGDYPLDLGLTWTLSREPALKLEGKAKIGGDLKALRVEHDLMGSAEVQLVVLVREVLDRPNWEGKLSILSLDLPAIQADLPAVDLTGELTTSGNLDDARIQGSLVGEAPDLPDFGRLNATLDVTWRERVVDIVALELTEDESGALLTADGELDLTGSVGQFNLQAAWEKLRWPLTGVPVAEARQGKIDIGGTFEAFRYQVSAEVWGRDFPVAKLRLTGQGTPEATQIEDLQIDTLDGTIEAEGRVAWAPELDWELNLTGHGIDPGVQWPDLPARVGLDLTSSGGLDAFTYRLEAEMQGEALPAATLALNGQGDIDGTRIESLRLQTLDGHLDAKADVAWAPVLTWDAELDLANINPGKQWPEWAGVLGGRILSEGKLEDSGPDLSARVESLKGKLRGYPVDVAAKVRMQGAEIEIEELRLASGPSNLRVAGTVGERLDLEIGLSSPNLESLLPDARGSIKASSTITGTLEAPAVKLGLSANGVTIVGQQIQSLSGSADVDLAPGGPMKIDLTGQGLLVGGMAFDSLRLEGDGDMGSHRLSAKASGEPLAFDLKATGGLGEDMAYAGQVEGLELRSAEFGTWRLQKPAPVSLDGPRIGAGPLCIREQGGSGGCLGFEQQEAGTWSATLDLDRLAFALFAAFVPEGLALEGEAGAKADFKSTGGVLSGTAKVQVPKGALSLLSGEEQSQLVDFSSTNLAVDVGAKGLEAKLAAPLKGLGDLSGDVSLPGWSLEDPASPDQSLRGRLQARVDDLGVVSQFVPDIRNLTGNLDADIKLGGSLSKPDLGGFAKLANGGLEIPFIGLEIQDIELDAKATRSRLDYSGGLTVGDGRLGISGQTLLTDQGPITRIAAKGDRLTLADSKEYFVLAAVDIEAEIGPTGTQLKGTLTVPEARIRPRSIPAGSVSPSPDVVVASELEEKQSRYATSIDLRLVLGKAVTVNAFGVEGSIEGELAVLQQPGKEILGDGELKIVDGTYRISTGRGVSAAIGKPLTIEQGFLNYAKSPIGNPFLVLTAQREGGDVTAGLRVFGTIKNPKMTFFSASDPGMSQSEVTTYLLTGIPPKRNADESGGSALSLGTYVAPKLFAEYDYSLGDEADKIKLRYDLNDWIELQTETGDSQGGDIFFKIEN